MSTDFLEIPPEGIALDALHGRRRHLAQAVVDMRGRPKQRLALLHRFGHLAWLEGAEQQVPYAPLGREALVVGFDEAHLGVAPPLGRNAFSPLYTTDYQYTPPYNDLYLPPGIGSANGLEFSV